MNEAINANLSQEAAANVNQWLSSEKYIEYKEELLKLIAEKKWQHLEDCFFKNIEFGTAGRRGTTGIGPNRINTITIGESAQALCEYALEANEDAKRMGIVIACDTRLSSPELSKYAATVCAANGFTTYIFDSFRSTPELSFAVRHLHTVAGIVISASHNPPADNGFKVCWTDGGQLVSPHDKGVMKKALEVQEILTIDFDTAVNSGAITIIGESVDKAYISAASSEAEGEDRNLNIVYSPLHGAGQTNVLPVLTAAGFSNISVVEDQMVPDGNFPTIENGKPNPEEKIANDRAVAQMLEEEADIAITNDPDADRIGVIVRHAGEPVYLTGNQSAVLAAHYVMKKMHGRNEITKLHYIAKTIVTTDMLSSLAQDFEVKMYGNLLVGFKYIGELIHSKEDTNEIFIIGGEESYGLLKGTYARDKDGATGALPLAEYAAELKTNGTTLYDELLSLYERYGLFVEHLDNAYFEGAAGFGRMQSVMKQLRENTPTHVGDHLVTAINDYHSLKRHDSETGKEGPIDCKATGNVIVLEFDGDPRKRITVRPSGTEPKIKLYVQWYEEAGYDVEEQYAKLYEHITGLSKHFEGHLLAS